MLSIHYSILQTFSQNKSADDWIRPIMSSNNHGNIHDTNADMRIGQHETAISWDGALQSRIYTDWVQTWTMHILRSQCLETCQNPATRFHTCGDLKKHFKRCHLDHRSKDQPIDCPYPACKMTSNNIMHLQKHAAQRRKTLTLPVEKFLSQS